MSDLAKCEKTDCPVKETCKRYTVIPNPFQQAYLQPNFDQNGTCLVFIPAKVK